jgi:ABC-type lipoprotein release transport system permease subunit
VSTLRGALADARRGLRLRRRRSLLTALGICLAAAMLSAAVVVADGLGRGFERASRAADLPDVIVRFDPQPAGRVAARIASLPDIAGYTTRLEVTAVGVGTAGGVGTAARRRDDAAVEVVDPAARGGYAIVAGHGLDRRGREVLVERAFADAWRVRVGQRLFVEELGWLHVVGLTEAPDNVGFPLAKPRIYVSRPAIEARFGADPSPRANIAAIWLRDPRYLDEVLVQARATSFGLHNIRFATRSGVRVLLDQAAGVVIDLLVALSAIALLTASTMLFASARAEVQRRLGAIGVRRAVGASRTYVAATSALEALMIAAPAAAIGIVAGLLATSGPDERLLTLLNEPPPGSELVLPLLCAWLACLAIPAAGAGWPAWRAGSQRIVGLLRGADVAGSPDRGRGRWRARGPRRTRATHRAPAGLVGLGARLVATRRARLIITALTLGVSTAFVLLMLAVAGALNTLETDPGALGKQYQLTAALPPDDTAAVRRVPGVEAVAPRYELQAADSFALGESVSVVAFGADHTRFEAPELISGRRLRGTHEAEVGAGLADALGLTEGSTLALALPGGSELRLRVSGIVGSLAHDGRVAYVPAAPLLAAEPDAPSQLAIRLAPSANSATVSSALSALGAPPVAAAGATARGAPLVDTLRTIVIAVAIIDGLVCLYALVQACALTVQERRRTIAVLRSFGGGPRAVRQLLSGAVVALVLPAAVIGVVLERVLFGPALADLAAGYASLPLTLGLPALLATLGGVALAGGLAVLWVARGALREPVIEGVRG